MNTEERKKKYLELFKDLIAQIKEEKSELEKYRERTKTLAKTKKNAEIVKAEIIKRESEIKKLQELFKLIKISMDDKWTPIPIYSPDVKTYKNEKINNDVPDSIIQLHLGKTDYNKPTMFLEMALFYGEEENDEEHIFQEHGIVLKDKKKLDFDHTINIVVDKSKWKSLFRKQILFDIYKPQFIFRKKLKGNFVIDLKDLKEKCTFKDKIKINLESKRFTPYIEVEIKLHEPFFGKEYETIEKPILSIKKIFPSFKAKNGNQNAIEFEEQAPNINPESFKKNQKQQPKNNSTKKSQQTNQSKQPQQSNQPLPKPKNHVDKSELNEDHIKDPGNGDLYRTLYCLNDALKILDEQIQKIDGRTPRPLLQKKIKFQTMIQYLNENLGEEIDVETYKQLLQQDLMRDKKLCDYFMQENDKPKYAIVSARYNSELRELKELETIK